MTFYPTAVNQQGIGKLQILPIIIGKLDSTVTDSGAGQT